MKGHKTKLQLTDTMLDVTVKMAEGNPGAMTVIMRLIKENAAIDPDSALGEWGAILMLDDLGIYGSAIWVLYKDTCGQNIANFVATIRACQLGIIGSQTLLDWSDETKPCDPEQVRAAIVAVKERLPRFNIQINEAVAA